MRVCVKVDVLFVGLSPNKHTQQMVGACRVRWMQYDSLTPVLAFGEAEPLPGSIGNAVKPQSAHH